MSEDVLLLIRSAIIQVLFLPNNEQRRAFWPKSASHFQHQRRNNQQIQNLWFEVQERDKEERAAYKFCWNDLLQFSLFYSAKIDMFELLFHVPLTWRRITYCNIYSICFCSIVNVIEIAGSWFYLPLHVWITYGAILVDNLLTTQMLSFEVVDRETSWWLWLVELCNGTISVVRFLI